MKLTWADKLLIGILLLLASGGIVLSVYLFPLSTPQQAEIRVEGKLVKTVALRPGYREEIRIGGQEHYNIIEVDGDRIRVREADCPDQICVKTGWVRSAPRQVVCLPWKVVITIVSVESADIDDIAR